MCMRALFAVLFHPHAERQRITSVVDAIARLNRAKSLLDQRIDLLERLQADRERDMVELRLKWKRVENMPSADRRKLKTAIRRRLMCQLSVQKFANVCSMLDRQILAIQDNEATNMAMMAIKAGNKISRQQSDALETLDVERLMVDFVESDELAKNIADSMSHTAKLDDEMTDQQALDELERLIEEERIQQKFVGDETSVLLSGLPGVATGDPTTKGAMSTATRRKGCAPEMELATIEAL